MKTCIIFDIDGTICDSKKRQKKFIDFDAKNKGDIQEFLKSLDAYTNSDHSHDAVIPIGAELLKWAVNGYNPDKIFFVTARLSDSRLDTEKWLKDHNLFNDKCMVIMKPSYKKNSIGNFLIKVLYKDEKYKYDVVQKIQKKFDVELAVDDKHANCKVFESFGIPTIHAMYCKLPLN